MQRINTFLRTCGMVSFFGLAALALPLPAHAGDLRVSIGFGVPMPVVVAPQPVIVHRAPVVVVQPQVVYAQPQVIYAQPQIVYTQPYYAGYRKPWRHHHHDHDDGDHED